MCKMELLELKEKMFNSDHIIDITPTKDMFAISLTLDGDFETFNGDPLAKDALITDVADKLHLAKKLIYLGRCEPGSIKAQILISKAPDGSPSLSVLTASAAKLVGASLGGYSCLTAEVANAMPRVPTEEEIEAKKKRAEEQRKQEEKEREEQEERRRRLKEEASVAALDRS